MSPGFVEMLHCLQIRVIILFALTTSPVNATAQERIDFTPVNEFLKLPAGMELGQCSAVDVDSRGNVYVIQRKSPPILCFDSSGRFLFSWGTPLIGHAPEMRGAHGLRVDQVGNVWITDRARHLVRKFDRTGRLLLTLNRFAQSWEGL